MLHAQIFEPLTLLPPPILLIIFSTLSGRTAHVWEQQSCSARGDQLTKAVFCSPSQTCCLGRSKQNFKFSSLPCSHHHQQSPGFLLQPCSLPSSASCLGWHWIEWDHLQRWRSKEILSFSISLYSSPPLSLNLSLSLILLSFRDHVHSDINILTVSSKFL